MRLASRRLRFVVFAMFAVAGTLLAPAVQAQTAPVEITKTDITKQKTIDASQWTALGVRLGDSKDAALKTLQRVTNVKVQEDAASGRIFVISPATSNTVVMGLKVIEGQVTTINLVGGFAELLQGDTKLLFRAFEDDSLRHKLMGREDTRDALQGGTKEAPTVDITYTYFKEGILLHYSAKFSTEKKQMESQRELVMIYPARQR